MKTHIILKTMVTVLLAVIFSTLADARPTLTPAQIAARQAQLEQDLLLLMPPMPPPQSPAMLKKMQAKKAMLAMNKNGNGGTPLSPDPILVVPSYTVIDLGALVSNDNNSYAMGINASGQVVGYSSKNSSDNIRGAFLYSNGLMQGIGTLGGDESFALGINVSGQIVGYSGTVGNNAYDAFLYSNGSMQDIGTLGGGESVAYGINASGQIVGDSYINTSGSVDHAFLYSGGSMQDLGTLGGDASYAYSINDSGQIVGYSLITGNTAYHAFLYSNGSMQNLGTLGGYYSEALGINASGQIVGDSYTTGNTAYHAFLYSGGSMQDLGTLGGTLSAASAINASGQIVGDSYVSGNTWHAFLYSGAVMYDLNDLLVNTSSGWTLQKAYGINDAGQIVGYGTISGHTHAFLLNPLPAGWKEKIETLPSQPAYGITPTRGSGKDSLVVVTHGWTPKLFNPSSPPNPDWVDSMSNSISSYFTSHSLNNWQVYGYKWIQNSWKLNPTDALNNAAGEGENLGLAIVSGGWSHVHLIAHSAGAEVIQVACEWIKTLSPTTTVHCTFLDPFVGFDYAKVSRYGDGADWAENYFSRDSLTRNGGFGVIGPFTESLLVHAYNVDVTQLDPSKITTLGFQSSVTGESEPCTKTSTSHEWPYEFYINTITGNGVTSDYAGFGFPLSEEGGNWNYALAHYASGNNPAQIIGTPDPTCTTFIHMTPPSYINTLIDFIHSPTIQSDTGTIQKWLGSIKLFSGSPAWLATVVTSTNPVNVISFDTEFISNNGAQGLLSVLWDDQIIGSIDERVIADTNHYSFKFPNATANSSHILGFRLDPFTNIQSVVIVTNIVLNQVGVSQPFSLSMTTNIVNGSRVFQLTGETGFEYHIQASTNLVDWSDIAVLQNTNGAVRFFDQSSTNSPMKFYRGVAP